MLRRSRPHHLREIPALDDDPTLFDPSPEWFVPGLEPSARDDEEDEVDGLGLRSLIEKPEALAKAWRATGRERHRARAHRTLSRTKEGAHVIPA